MTRDFHVSFRDTIELLRLAVILEKTCLEHRSWSQIVITTSNHVHIGVRADLYDLKVVRQANLEVSFRLAVIDLGFSHLIVVPVVHEDLF